MPGRERHGKKLPIRFLGNKKTEAALQKIEGTHPDFTFLKRHTRVASLLFSKPFLLHSARLHFPEMAYNKGFSPSFFKAVFPPYRPTSLSRNGIQEGLFSLFFQSRFSSIPSDFTFPKWHTIRASFPFFFKAFFKFCCRQERDGENEKTPPNNRRRFMRFQKIQRMPIPIRP